MSQTQVIAKIEERSGLEASADILEAADGIVLSRGNLGVDLPPEKLFLAQVCGAGPKLGYGLCGQGLYLQRSLRSSLTQEVPSHVLLTKSLKQTTYHVPSLNTPGFVSLLSHGNHTRATTM